MRCLAFAGRGEEAALRAMRAADAAFNATALVSRTCSFVAEREKILGWLRRHERSPRIL